MLDHIRKISFGFFFALGLAHFITGLLYINGYFAPTSGLVNRVLFIPFVLSTLTYCFANFKHALIEYGKDSKTWNYVFIVSAVVVFLGLLAIEFFAPDSLTPLIK